MTDTEIRQLRNDRDYWKRRAEAVERKYLESGIVKQHQENEETAISTKQGRPSNENRRCSSKARS
jgi:hypothetical protein